MEDTDCRIIASACLAYRAGDRLISALESWGKELTLETDHDLTDLIHPLRNAYLDARTLAMAAVKLRPLEAPWGALINRLVDFEATINKQVTKLWQDVSPRTTGGKLSPEAKNLSEEWRAKNPLEALLPLLNSWHEDLRIAWTSSAQTISNVCAPAPPPKDKLIFFIASSTEGLTVANKLIEQLKTLTKTKTWEFWCWKDPHFFPTGESTLETLEKRIRECHFGIYVMTADDQLVMRNKETISARGNVVFEFGMGVGRQGRKRSFVVHADVDKISDLDGITTIGYKAPANGQTSFVSKILWNLRGKPASSSTHVSHLAPDDQEVERIAKVIIQGCEREIAASEAAWRHK